MRNGLLAALVFGLTGTGAAATAQEARPGTAPGAMPIRAAAPAESSFGNYRPPKLYSEQVHHSFYVPMRDGTKIAVLVARPALNGKAVDTRYPVIWHHSLSATQEEADGTGGQFAGLRALPRLTDFGYVVVQVARRGNGQSFGTMRGYHDRNEDADAYELIEWLARQPWSDGNIGQYGCSNTGDAAVHAMTGNAPHLRAVFAGCFSWNKYDAMRRGGIFAQWGTGPTRTVEQDMKIPPVQGDEDKVLLRQAAEQHQRGVPLFELWKSMPYRDSFARSVQSTFWSEGSVSSYKPQILQQGLPLYIMGGWKDELRDQGLIAWMNVPGARILIGDWLHCNNDGFALEQEAHRFFDRYLKGLDTGIDREDPIHYFTVGPDAWRTASQWPLPSAVQTAFALSSKGLLKAGPGAVAPLRTSFAVDYKVDCPKGGFGPFMQPCHIPGNGLSITGQPLKAPVEFTGHGIADVWIAADTPDANLFAYIEDVAPDGSVRVVTEGRLKARIRKLDVAPWTLPGIPWHRGFEEDAQTLRPGVPARMVFDIMPASWVFAKGHRIQVTFTGSDWRERARDADAQPTRITVISDNTHPSTVSLPLVNAQ